MTILKKKNIYKFFKIKLLNIQLLKKKEKLGEIQKLINNKILC